MANKTSSLVFTIAFCGCLFSGAAQAEAPDLASLAQTAAKTRGGGGTPIAIQEGKLAASEIQRLLLKLEPRQCVVAAAAGVDVTDLELSVKTPEGLSLGDGEPGAVARLRYCAGTQAEKAQIRVRSDKPTAYSLGVWAVQVGAVESAPAAVPSPVAKAPATLPQQLALVAKDHANGMEAMTAPREEDLGSGDARERDVPLQAGRCYRFLAVAEAKLVAVDLTLKDAKGAELLTEHGGDTTSVLGEERSFCPANPARFRLAIAVQEGTGHVLWQVFGAPDPRAVSRWKVGGEGDSLVAKRMRASHERMGEAKPAVMPYQEGKLATAQGAQAMFDVQPGLCYVAVAAGTPSVRSLDLEIVDQRGNIVAQALDQGSLARARVCSGLKSRWTARLRVFKGYGEYALQVFGGP